MSRSSRSGVLIILALAVCVTLSTATHPCFAADGKIRPAMAAGSFYPADKKELRETVDGLLRRAHPGITTQSSPLAIIVPHAGYGYSGAVAATSFALLQGHRFKRVVVIAPSHYEDFSYSSVYDGEAYTTPLGKVRVDGAFARRLAQAEPSVRLGSIGHTGGTRPEHAIEVELPFLQRALGDFVLVPIVMGDSSYAASHKLGRALAKLLADSPETLLVASSDLSHYHDADTAAVMDRGLLDAVGENNAGVVSRQTSLGNWEACGVGPILAVMLAAERLGAGAPRILKYANSGDEAGQTAQVVGYGAAVFFREPHARASVRLSEAERNELLAIARASAEMMVREKRLYVPALPASPRLVAPRAVFVTVKQAGALRGCMGELSARRPLYMAVRDAAALAVRHDPRFLPVRESELAGSAYEVSVLSPLRPMLQPEHLRAGKDGLMIRRGDAQAMLLPQIATEEHWDRTMFLEQTARKAGLAADGWQAPEADLFSFTVLVVSEQSSAARVAPAAPVKVSRRLVPPAR